MTQTFNIQDESGHVFNRVENPAVVFDKASGTVDKIGEYDNMLVRFNQLQALYRKSGFPEIADDIVLMELPKDQEEIDKVFQITGYVKRLYEKTQVQA